MFAFHSGHNDVLGCFALMTWPSYGTEGCRKNIVGPIQGSNLECGDLSPLLVTCCCIGAERPSSSIDPAIGYQKRRQLAALQIAPLSGLYDIFPTKCPDSGARSQLKKIKGKFEICSHVDRLAVFGCRLELDLLSCLDCPVCKPVR